jgi:hypothetical protein
MYSNLCGLQIPSLACRILDLSIQPARLRRFSMKYHLFIPLNGVGQQCIRAINAEKAIR